MANYCRQRDTRQYDFVMIQTPRRFYRTSLIVEHWILPGHLDTTKPAIYCVDAPIQVNQRPVYGANAADDNFNYIIPGTFPLGTYYPEHCSGTYIGTVSIQFSRFCCNFTCSLIIWTAGLDLSFPCSSTGPQTQSPHQRSACYLTQ